MAQKTRHDAVEVGSAEEDDGPARKPLAHTEFCYTTDNVTTNKVKRNTTLTVFTLAFEIFHCTLHL